MKIKGLELIQNNRMFDRTSRYLADKARAVRRQQGLKVGADPDDEIVLGDKTTTMLGTGAALVLSAGIIAASLIGWKLLDEKTPTPPAADTNTDTTYQVEKWVPGAE